MDEQTLLRYSRQILLPQIDIEGQQSLLNSHAVIFGLGGLGSPVAMYLAAAGVGKLTLVDFDVVELSNLQRQIVHSTADLNRPKVESARDRLHALNPKIEIDTVNEQLNEQDMRALVNSCDVVVDGTDNFDTRYLINRVAYVEKKPHVSGAAIRFEGQVSVFRHDQEHQPCYQCIYHAGVGEAETCSQTGVVAPLLGIIGSVQALETIKVITGAGNDLSGRLLLLDALAMEWHTMRFKKDPKCPVCSI
ncbi:MAG: molybdopterin-synthase adenylyltransferase MoeB [Pseudomonadota bacterium]